MGDTYNLYGLNSYLVILNFYLTTSINPATSHVLMILPKLKLSSKQDDLKSLEGKNLHQRFSLGLNLVKKEKLELIIYVLNITKSTGK